MGGRTAHSHCRWWQTEVLKRIWVQGDEHKPDRWWPWRPIPFDPARKVTKLKIVSKAADGRVNVEIKVWVIRISPRWWGKYASVGRWETVLAGLLTLEEARPFQRRKIRVEDYGTVLPLVARIARTRGFVNVGLAERPELKTILTGGMPPLRLG